MYPDRSKLKLFLTLWRHIKPRRKKQFKLLLLLVIISAFAEVISIGAVLPFLGALTSPERLYEHSMVKPLAQSLGIKGPTELLLPMTLLFIFAAIMAGGIRLLLIWASTRLSFITGADIGLSIYRRTLYQPYSTHVGRNSSEVINGITRKADSVINQTILPILNCVSYGVILLFILTILIAISPGVALGSFGTFGFFYACVMIWNRKTLQKDSKGVALESTRVVRALQEGLGGIRDVLIDGSQSVYSDVFQKSDLSLRKSQGNIVFIGSSPRFALEAFGMVGIATLAYFLVLEPGGINDAIPILGGLAVGAQRLLPALQGLYGGWVNMKGGRDSLRDAVDLLEQPIPEYADKPRPTPIKFTDILELNDVSFRYGQNEPWILKNINLKISKGQRIGIIGASGGGKSTLIDLIMGLLVPNSGYIKIDGQSISDKNTRAWQSHIAHVPQSIYLSDATIKENIAFGVPVDMIDNARVHEAANKASLSSIIEKMEDGFETIVGEQGARLSGGQRQRIGIARTLYKNADVLVFDEATSALDGGTESEVMNALHGLDNNLTIIIIAHRLSTLAECDKIIEIENGNISRIDSFENITKAKD